MRASIGNRISPFYLLGTICIILVWQLAAWWTNGALPGLGAIFASLCALGASGELWRHLHLSLFRSLIGMAAGAALGFSLGAVSGFVSPIYYFLKPLMGVLLSVPAVAVVMLAMVWFGMGSIMAVFVTALFTVPIMYVSVVEGMAMVDGDLLEMAAVYRVSRWNLWWDIYWPALATATLTGLAYAAGTAFRKTVMAELLGSNEGVGYAMAVTRFNLDTARFFAWVTVCLAVAASIEVVMVRPIAKRFNLWRGPRQADGPAYE